MRIASRRASVPLVLMAILAMLPLVHGRAAAQCVTSFNRLSESGGPVGNCALAWDSQNQRVLAVDRNSLNQAELWEWTGGNWTVIEPFSDKPPANAIDTNKFTFDEARHRAVLVGPSAVYEFDSQRWWTYPTAEYAHAGDAITYDTRRGLVMAVSATESESVIMSWNGAAWEVGPGLGFRAEGARLSYDPGVDKLILYFTASDFLQTSRQFYFIYGDTLAQGHWEEIIETPRYAEPSAPTMVTDPRRSVTYILGGTSGGSAPYAHYILYFAPPETPVWRGLLNAWDEDEGRAAMGSVYDPVRDTIIVHGGLARHHEFNGPITVIPYSDTWELSVPGPGIDVQGPPQTTVCQGQTLVLSVLPFDNNQGELHAIWMHDNWTIVGANNPAALAVPNAQPSDTGDYRVNITNGCGTVTSRAMHVDVIVPAALLAEPVWPQTVCPGATITIPVPAFAGTRATLTLQRLYDGQWVDFAAPSGAAFVIPDATHSTTGEYRVVVSNACATAASQPHHIQVGVSVLPDSAVDMPGIEPCANLAFGVQAQGNGIMTFEWMHDGVPVASDARVHAGTPTLTFDGAHYEDQGVYQCRVTDACGDSVLSGIFNVRLRSPGWHEVPMNLAQHIGNFSANPWSMAYDEHRGVVVLYGGQDFRGYPSNTLMEYDGLSWAMVHDGWPGYVPSGQQPFSDGGASFLPASSAMAYNPDDQKMYILSELNANFPIAIWTWDGAAWQRPYYGPLIGGAGDIPRMVYDRVRRLMVIVRRPPDGNYESQYLTYDPATNALSAPTAMQPAVDLGVYRAALVYDEFRQRTCWFVNDGVGFRPASMYGFLAPAAQWVPFPGIAPAFDAPLMAYDPVARALVELGGGAFSQNNFYGFYTATWQFPYSITPPYSTPPAADWQQVLPDGPEHDAAGLGLSPTNYWSARTLAFDRFRRTMVAMGYDARDYTMRTWERPYADAVVFGRPAAVLTAPQCAVGVQVFADGAGILTYQWQVETTPDAWSNLTQAGTPLPCGGVAKGDSPAAAATTVRVVGCTVPRIYLRCLVTNSCGTQTSGTVALSNPAGSCDADFNCSGTASVQDIFDFLAAYFSADPRADFNTSGTISVQDIFDFLAAFFAGCT